MGATSPHPPRTRRAGIDSCHAGKVPLQYKEGDLALKGRDDEILSAINGTARRANAAAARDSQAGAP